MSGCYFELWRRGRGAREQFWYLDRAYLTLFAPGSDGCNEYVCLHCDPNEPDEMQHSMYKRVPHLHINAAPAPFPHAHLALNLGFKDQVLESVSSLTDAMEYAMLMLREQILDELVSQH